VLERKALFRKEALGSRVGVVCSENRFATKSSISDTPRFVLDVGMTYFGGRSHRTVFVAAAVSRWLAGLAPTVSWSMAASSAGRLGTRMMWCSIVKTCWKLNISCQINLFKKFFLLLRNTSNRISSLLYSIVFNVDLNLKKYQTELVNSSIKIHK